jgi:ligand-binding sensor domain-containing protein
MKFIFFIIIQIISSVFICKLYAQNNKFKFNLVEGNNGEPIGNINAISQDPNGYMWFSGQGANCLYRYDGSRMLTFKHDASDSNTLGRRDLETVYADANGIIWIGFFNGGMDQYDPGTGTFKHYMNDSTDPGSLGSGMVSVILRDHSGKLWVGTRSGLDQLDEKTGKFKHYRHEPGNLSSLSCDAVRAIYEDHQGVLWIGTGFEFDNSPDEGGLNRIESNGTFTRYLHDPDNPQSLINNKVRSIFEDSRGIFWIGTSGDGLHTMDRVKGTFERHLYNPAEPDELSRPPLKSDQFDPITFIREDSTGAIWIGTYVSGINRYDIGTKKITHFESGNGYPDKGCWQAYTSRDGVLWIASVEGTPFLYRVDPSLGKINNINSGAKAFCFHETEPGSLWVGSEIGLLQYDREKKLIHQIKEENQDSINFSKTPVISIFQNQQDTLWLGTTDGIVLFNIKTNKFKRLTYITSNDHQPKTFSGSFINRIIQDKTGIKWFATWGQGLVQFNSRKESVKHFLPFAKDTVNSNSNLLSDVLEDSSGDIWTSSLTPGVSSIDLEKGISRLNTATSQFSHYLNGISIFSLLKDSEGNIWAGTEKGLYRFNRENDRFIQFFDSQSDLREEIIQQITEDDLENLWLLTPSSIVRLNRDRKGYFIYGRKYGIKPESLLFGGIGKTARGEILVGNPDGFYSFYPGEMNSLTKPLKIIISDFFINNSRMFSGKLGPLKKPIEETSEIYLKHDQNNLFFRIAVIDYRTPEANKVYTMLENFDNVWREASGDKSASFINVPPGEYLFRVKASNIDGITAEKTIQIVISPPWWKTWWAFSIYGLMLICLSFVINRV